jgi:hypothetical protein
MEESEEQVQYLNGMDDHAVGHILDPEQFRQYLLQFQRYITSGMKVCVIQHHALLWPLKSILNQQLLPI